MNSEDNNFENEIPAAPINTTPPNSGGLADYHRDGNPSEQTEHVGEQFTHQFGAADAASADAVSEISADTLTDTPTDTPADTLSENARQRQALHPETRPALRPVIRNYPVSAQHNHAAAEFNSEVSEISEVSEVPEVSAASNSAVKPAESAKSTEYAEPAEFSGGKDFQTQSAAVPLSTDTNQTPPDSNLREEPQPQPLLPQNQSQQGDSHQEQQAVNNPQIWPQTQPTADNSRFAAASASGQTFAPDNIANQNGADLHYAGLNSADNAASLPYLQALPKKQRKRRGPSWSAFVVGMILSALLGTVMSVGIMSIRYDGTRPSTFSTTEAKAEPVVKTDGKTPDWEAVAKTVGPTVVAIDAQSNSGSAAGSGVIIDKEGHILTNDHVISGAKDIWVKLSDGRLFAAKLDGKDPATDLAVISLENPPSDLAVAVLGNSSELKVGEPVAAIGNPLGLSSTMTSGIVSALDRPVQTLNREAQNISDARVVTNAIQLDAAVNPGNSGGPVFDAQGRVIGIASSIATTQASESAQGGSIGLGFAIPIDLAKNIADQLIENGVAEHAYLGVTIRDGVARYGAEQRLGAQIDSVQPGTPAANAKLREGDVVVAVNGRKVVSAVSLTGYVRQYKSGERVTLTIARNGELQDLDVVLATKVDQ
ncbi:trypsin-like peptidase domain-containing protein [Arcanobacterium hippocoleae]